MHRLFADLVLSRDGATARPAPLAFPASLVLHAAAATVVILVPLLTREALPDVETAPTRIPGFVTLPRSAGDGIARPPALPRPPRPAPRAMAFVPSRLPAPENESMDVPTTEGTEPVDGAPCLIGCDAGGVPGGEPGGGGILGAGVPSVAPPAPIRTGGDIRPPLKMRNVVPPYPEVARAARIQGDVVLDCTISNEGRVVDVKILSGPVPLQAAAVDAVRQWLYRPTLLNGVPVPVVMTVTVHFALDRRR